MKVKREGKGYQLLLFPCFKEPGAFAQEVTVPNLAQTDHHSSKVEKSYQPLMLMLGGGPRILYSLADFALGGTWMVERQ